LFLSWYTPENMYNETGHNCRVSNCVKRKVDVLFRDETINPEKTERQ